MEKQMKNGIIFILISIVSMLSGQNPYIQLPALSSGMYTLQVSCRCTDMRDATFPLTVVDEWVEQHEIAPNLPALHLLAERTGGQILTTVP